MCGLALVCERLPGIEDNRFVTKSSHINPAQRMPYMVNITMYTARFGAIPKVIERNLLKIAANFEFGNFWNFCELRGQNNTI